MFSIVQSKLLGTLITIAALGLVGWLTPFAPFKFIVALASIVILALSLRVYIKRIAGLVVLSIVIFLLPMTVNLYSRVIFQALENLNVWPYVSVQTERKPTATIQIEPSISIKIDGSLEVSLVEGRSLEYPSELNVRNLQDRLEISGGVSSKKYVLRIGTDVLKTLQLSATSISLKGEGSLEQLELRATAVNVSGNLVSTQLLIDGTGVNMSGNFSGENLIVDGTGVNLNGRFSFTRTKIDGTGVNLKVELSNCESVIVDAVGVNGTIDVTGTLPTVLVLNGTGGTVTVRNKIGNKLQLQSSNVKIRSE
uniref:Adhesin domain-containing protein n=1 Tax=Pseudothermotoga hypogea TaxID=57487 RepID=A0A832MP15_9THEM